MEIGNGIGRWKPLNAHVNLHRLLFCILHILGEICTATKVLHHRSGQSDNYHFQLWTCSLRLWNRRGKYDMGESIKLEFFRNFFFYIFGRLCVYPCTCPSWKPDYLIVSFCVFANCNQGRLRLSLSHLGRWAQLPVLCLTSAEPTHSGSSNVTHLGPRWVIRK